MKSVVEILAVANQGPYTPDWESLNNFEVPSWFKKAKFGIFIHWGLYSVPAFHNEWYSRNMYIAGSPEFAHHVDTYGPQAEFGYQDFIPQFTAEKFDPKAWAKLFKQAGAQYIFPVAEHHDGFQMYQSELSEWNAFEKGPQCDVLGELKSAITAEDMHFCTSSHRAEHWFFMSHGKEFASDIHEPLQKGDFYWPAQPEPEPEDLFSTPTPTPEFLDDWLLRTCEIIDRYQPEILYFDWWIQHQAFKKHLQILAAYYYNRGVENNFPAAICYKHDAMMFGTGLVEIERGKFAAAQPFYWQTDTAIAKNSWCYTDTLDYKSVSEILQTLVEVVSKNGNLLLNVGPKGDGSIPARDEEILRAIGAWLDVNGEAIYGSKPWRKAGEGPTVLAEGQFQEEKVAYTPADMRFTVNGASLYALLLVPPTENKIVITSLKQSVDQNLPEFHGIIAGVEILGAPDSVENFVVTPNGLEIALRTVDFAADLPVVVKIILE